MQNSFSDNLRYHIEELRVARDPASPSHILPEYSANEKVILDIGCGIGQTLSVSGLDDHHLLIGLDVDQESLEYGGKLFPSIRFLNSRSEALPFPAAAFDLVIARVALPYTNIPTSLREIKRVLKPGGRMWMTLHPFSKIWNQLCQDVKSGNLKGIVFRKYVLLNGTWFHLTGRMFSFPFSKRFESFQTTSRMFKALTEIHFTMLQISTDKHFLIEAQKVTSPDNRSPIEKINS